MRVLRQALIGPYSYPLHPADNPPKSPTPRRDHLSSHENRSGGELVLGHTSLLTSFLLTPDERYIITADRDEHIRVSWYPEGYSIERFCLGHTKYVCSDLLLGEIVDVTLYILDLSRLSTFLHLLRPHSFLAGEIRC